MFLMLSSYHERQPRATVTKTQEVLKVKKQADNMTGAKIGTVESACARYGFGRNKLREVAEDAGAVIKLGRSVRINFTIMDAYFDALSGGN